jgi:hypothetical protein
MAGATPLHLPPEVGAVFREFRTAEFSTIAKDGTPITWPTLPFYDAERGRFLVTTSIGLPQTVFNVRRNPRVALLFSDPTASGLDAPPAVLVQGNAAAPDEVVTELRGYEDALRQVFERQPESAMYSSNAPMRAIFDWYYMRLLIHVTPVRLLWWPRGDFGQEPLQVEVPHAG